MTTIHKQPRSARRAILQTKLHQQHIRAALIHDPEDVRYLSGFTGEDSHLLLAPKAAFLITDGRFAEQAKRECPGAKIILRRGPLGEVLAPLLKKQRIRTLGVQGNQLPHDHFIALQKRMRAVKLISIGALAEQARMVKDPEEIKWIRRAIRLAESALGDLLAVGRKAFVGKTEREVAAEIEHGIRRRGGELPDFDIIVAAGAHSSMCHYRAGLTKIRPGDPVLIDWGARANGYHADLTRVVFTGRVPPRWAEIYATVQRAQQAAMRIIRPGIACKEVDAAARNVIRASGAGELFVHSLGHGIGLDIHEAPSLNSRNETLLQAGMVITVEPGIYIPDFGGVRIEDDVLVTATGCRRLSTLPTDLADMVLK